MPKRPWAPPPLSGWKPMIINAALTGAVPTKEQAPALPTTPDEIVADALACAAAGASIIHVHVRDDQGVPVHRRDLYEEVFGALRDKAPELVLCATTSGRVDPDPDARMTALELEESLRPDMASLTLGSFNFPRTVSLNPPEIIEALLNRMLDQEVKPELEIFELGMVNTAWTLMERGLIRDPPYVNVLLGSMGAAAAFVGDLARIVERLPSSAEWAAAGIGVFQKPMIVAAAAMGGNARTGLEDNPTSDSDTLATNAAAVEHARSAATLVGRTVESPMGTRERLGLPQRSS